MTEYECINQDLGSIYYNKSPAAVALEDVVRGYMHTSVHVPCHHSSLQRLPKLPCMCIIDYGNCIGSRNNFVFAYANGCIWIVPCCVDGSTINHAAGNKSRQGACSYHCCYTHDDGATFLLSLTTFLE